MILGTIVLDTLVYPTLTEIQVLNTVILTPERGQVISKRCHLLLKFLDTLRRRE